MPHLKIETEIEIGTGIEETEINIEVEVMMSGPNPIFLSFFLKGHKS